MSNATESVKVIEVKDGRAIVSVNLAEPSRSVEREVSRRLKPYRLPKNPQVRAGVNLMLKNPSMTAAEASQQLVNSQRLSRRIDYWAERLITVGVKAVN